MADTNDNTVTIDDLQAQLKEARELNTRLKGSVDAATKDASAWKHKYEDVNGQLSARMTEQERLDAERAKEAQARDDELKALRRDKTVSEYKASYISLGYTAELAESTAIAYADGDHATVFKNQALFNESQKKSFEAAKVASQPGLTAGDAPKVNTSDMTDEEFYKNYYKR